MDLENLEAPTAGMMTPYSALFVFAIGIFISNFLFNTLVMKKPFMGEPVSYSQYFKGNFNTHPGWVCLGRCNPGIGDLLVAISLREKAGCRLFPMHWGKGQRW